MQQHWYIFKYNLRVCYVMLIFIPIIFFKVQWLACISIKIQNYTSAYIHSSDQICWMCFPYIFSHSAFLCIILNTSYVSCSYRTHVYVIAHNTTNTRATTATPTSTEKRFKPKEEQMSVWKKHRWLTNRASVWES